jgi:hypothetical protein
VSGPHFYVANPIAKTPRDLSELNTDYDCIDLTVVADDYLPQANYVPACSPAEYRERTPRWNGRAVSDLYRYAHREMVAPTGERTLAPCILPRGAAHIHTVFSVAFDNSKRLLDFAANASSIPIDFFV